MEDPWGSLVIGLKKLGNSSTEGGFGLKTTIGSIDKQVGNYFVSGILQISLRDFKTCDNN